MRSGGAPAPAAPASGDAATVVPDKASLLRKLSASSVPDSPDPAIAGGKVGFAIVGLGRAGAFHLTSLRALIDMATLRWVVDIDQARVDQVAAAEGCKGSTDFDQALADPEVDAVIICSVTWSHYGYCKAALAAGKAVFTEKPISHKGAELREIVDMAVGNGKAFVVGYQRRVDRNFRELKRQIDAGSIGGLRMIRSCSRDNPLPPLPYLKVSGGIFYDMLTHDFDMIHFLSGQLPVEVYSVGACYNEDIRAMDDIDTVQVTLSFASGLIATVDCSRVAAYGYDQRVEAFGETGMATAHNEQSSTVVIATESGFNNPANEFSFPERYKHTYATEIAEFVALVKAQGVEPEELVRRHIDLDIVTAAAELSYRLKRPIKLAEVEGLRDQLPH